LYPWILLLRKRRDLMPTPKSGRDVMGYAGIIFLMLIDITSLSLLLLGLHL
jgi:hypothetical protein